ncbi:hypothetical protein HK100_009356, partial [Physocladia obscura]
MGLSFKQQLQQQRERERERGGGGTDKSKERERESPPVPVARIRSQPGRSGVAASYTASVPVMPTAKTTSIGGARGFDDMLRDLESSTSAGAGGGANVSVDAFRRTPQQQQQQQQLRDRDRDRDREREREREQRGRDGRDGGRDGGRDRDRERDRDAREQLRETLRSPSNASVNATTASASVGRSRSRASSNTADALNDLLRDLDARTDSFAAETPPSANSNNNYSSNNNNTSSSINGRQTTSLGAAIVMGERAKREAEREAKEKAAKKAQLEAARELDRARLLEDELRKQDAEKLRRQNERRHVELADSQARNKAIEGRLSSAGLALARVAKITNAANNKKLPNNESIIVPEYINALIRTLVADQTIAPTPEDFASYDGFALYERSINKPLQEVLADLLFARHVEPSKPKSLPAPIDIFFKVVEAHGLIAKEGRSRDAYCRIEFGSIPTPHNPPPISAAPT